jgi:hypothetical protein
VQGTTQILLGSHAVAGHGIPLVVAVGKGWQASCWRGDAERMAGMSMV